MWNKKFCLPCLVFFAILFLSIGMFRAKTHQYPLSIVALFQNEDRFLKEWIDFHRLMGVEHFYLFNNLSTDSYLEVLQPYMDRGIVELYDWPHQSIKGNQADFVRIQSEIYRKGLELACGRSKWVAIIDIDEFLFPLQKNNLIEFLSDYNECCGILVNWQMFGTSHVQRIEKSGLLIEQLHLQGPADLADHTFCKSIVRPECVKYCVDAHSVIYYPWSYAVDPDKNIFPWKFHLSHPPKIDKVRINHYWSKDEDFLHSRKVYRTAVWGYPDAGGRLCLDRNDQFNQIVNLDIQRFVEPLKKMESP